MVVEGVVGKRRQRTRLGRGYASRRARERGHSDRGWPTGDGSPAGEPPNFHVRRVQRGDGGIASAIEAWPWCRRRGRGPRRPLAARCRGCGGGSGGRRTSSRKHPRHLHRQPLCRVGRADALTLLSSGSERVAADASRATSSTEDNITLPRNGQFYRAHSHACMHAHVQRPLFV